MNVRAALWTISLILILVSSSLASDGLSVEVPGSIESGIRLNPIPIGRAVTETSAWSDSQRPDIDSLRDQLRGHLQRALGTHEERNHARDTRVDAPPLNARIGRDVTVRIRPGSGTPMEIRGPRLHPSYRSFVAKVHDDADLQAARDFLFINRHILRLANPDNELELLWQVTDDLGRKHLRFQQTYSGLPVWPAQLTVHLDPDGYVDLLNGNFEPTPRKLSVKPAVASDAAELAALEGYEQEAEVSRAAELLIFAKPFHQPRLAWSVQIEESAISRWTVLVDAYTNRVLHRYTDVMTSTQSGSGIDLLGQRRSLNVWWDGARYWLIDTSKSMFNPSVFSPSTINSRAGAIWIADSRNLPPFSDPLPLPPLTYSITSTSATVWSPADGVSAAYSLSRAWDYFKEIHGRNSIDGGGGSLVSIVRYGLGFENAFWTGTAMVFGDGERFAAAQDVVAHEMTHGVIDHSADLVYERQSGALNEAFADIFGEMTENYASGPNDWKLGTVLSRAARSMSNPTEYGQPARFSDYRDLPLDVDHGGVHINSGIINHAFYQLVAGLQGAISKRDAERIFYRALTLHMTPRDEFIDARLKCVQAARELFGQNSSQAQKTAEAFDFVEIFDTTPPPPPPPIPPAASKDSTLFVFSEDGGYWLGRREEAKGDPDIGVFISNLQVTQYERVAVSGDGEIAFFVTADDDACFVRTDGTTAESCMGLPGMIASVGMSPDANRFGIVPLDSNGNRTAELVVIDLAKDQELHLQLFHPAQDGGSAGTVEFADSMDFTADGRYLFYDALTTLAEADGGEPLTAWSIYAYDFLSGQIFTIVGPVEGLDLGYPSLGTTSDAFIAFDAYDATTGKSTIWAGDLYSGAIKSIVTTGSGWGVPSHTGDDLGLVFQSGNDTPTGASLYYRKLSSDHVTPTGDILEWMSDASYPTIYRRGPYNGPTANPGRLQFSANEFSGAEGSTSTITVTRVAGNKGTVTVRYSTSNGSATAGQDYTSASGTLTWPDGDLTSRTFTVSALSDSAAEGTETVNLVLTSPTGGGTLGNPSRATLSIQNREPAPTQIPASERAALIALYNATDGKNWTKSSNWLGAVGSECSWFGVACSTAGTSVIRLELPENSLTGSIPADIRNLPSLTHLVLFENALTGILPTSIGELSQLTQLILDDNELSGQIPEALGSLSHLFTLSLRGNQFSGSIPSELGQLTDLETLYLNDNQLVGQIPPALFSLPKLRYLWIANNLLTGGISEAIGNAGNLESLWLSDNELSGQIPSSITTLSNLEYLGLHNNQLSGNLPPQLNNLVSLTKLVLAGNNLSGTIPPGLGSLQQLTYLSLYGNSFSGQIPVQLSRLANLTSLYLGRNEFSGEIPSWLGNLSKLRYLSLSDNLFSGSIPPELGNLKVLQQLFLYNNLLTGPIPDELGMVDPLVGSDGGGLEVLHLDQNQLTGVIPDTFRNLKYLKELILWRNQLSGPIPPWLGDLPNLTRLDLDDNQFTGVIPPELGNLTKLEKLFLGPNRLSGPVPPELGNLKELKVLYLHANALVGELPASIMTLSNLEEGELWLSHNGLYTNNPTLRTFINSKHPDGDFEATQTVAPTNLRVRSAGSTSVTLEWTPIRHTEGPGGYRIHVAESASGPFSVATSTSSKATSSVTVEGLTAATPHYFKVDTISQPSGEQQNVVISDTSPMIDVQPSARKRPVRRP